MRLRHSCCRRCDPSALLDLGFVPSDVAANNGYSCVTDGEQHLDGGDQPVT